MLREAETQSYNLTVFVYGKQADILLLLASGSLPLYSPVLCLPLNTLAQFIYSTRSLPPTFQLLTVKGELLA